MARYAGKKAVVTGGTRGIGMAVVKGLLAGGAEVLLTGHDERNVEVARDDLHGQPAHVVRSDSASMADVDALGRTAAERLGSVDLVFINAGYAEPGPVEGVTEASYDRMFNVKAKGAFFTTRRLLPMVSRGGSFVFTTDDGAAPGYAEFSVASGAAAAVGGFVKAFAAEFKPRGIRVNAVSPGIASASTVGLVETSAPEWGQVWATEADPRVRSARAAVEQAAAAVLFLAFEETCGTGIVLRVGDGLGHVAA